MRKIFLILTLFSFAVAQTKEGHDASCDREHKCECMKTCDRNKDPNKSEDPKCKSYCKPNACRCRPGCAT